MEADLTDPPPSLLEIASRRADLDTSDLLFWDDGANLAFIPRAVAELCLEALEQVQECATWGDARAKLPPDVFLSISRKCWDSRTEPPDTETLDPRIASSEGWPNLSEKDRRLWLPAVIYEQFGEHWVGFLQSGTRIPNENWEEIFEALEKLGIRSEYDWRIEVLFSQDS